MNKQHFRWLARPAIASLVTVVLLFIVLYALLRPGYWINDDLKIIWNAIGYPAGGQVPFLIHTNVLLGLLLMPLYALHTNLNWEVILFVLINVCSTWVLLYIGFALHSGLARAFSVAVTAACAAYVLLNITYTITAAWACMAGIAMLLTEASVPGSRSAVTTAVGVLLVLLGSMIRIQSLVPALGFAMPGMFLVLWRADKRRLVLVLIGASLAVGAAYSVDRLYVRSFPDWNYYYHYNSTRELLHDAHRLENAGFQIRRVGWSANDQELFAHWFFPDAQIYSLDHILFLVDHIPGTSRDLGSLASAYAGNLIGAAALPMLILMGSVVLWESSGRGPKVALLAACAVWGVAILENLVLAWAFKDPDYLLLSTLAGSAVFGLIVVSIFENRQQDARSQAAPKRPASALLLAASISMLLVGIGLITHRLVDLSTINTEKQSAYHAILADLQQLQSERKIASDALIISPAHGLPADWSNPFILDMPPIPYYDTGWITFSPSYEAVLRDFDITSLPDALYQKPNLYVMTQSNFTAFLARYYQEHEGRSVTFRQIYAMPNVHHIPDHDDIYLYKVLPAK